MQLSSKRITLFIFLWIVLGTPFLFISPQNLELTPREFDKAGVELWYLIILLTYVWKIQKRKDVSLFKKFIGAWLIGWPGVFLAIITSLLFSHEVVGFMLFELWFFVSNYLEIA